MKNLYRKKALEYLSSPDQLDNLMSFSSPGYWLSLIGIAIIIAVIIIWGIFGRIPKEVTGSGLIVRSGGIRQVQALGIGYLSTVNVKEGDVVIKGQPLAVIVQVQTLENIRTNKDNLRYLRREAEEIAELDKDKKKIHLASIEKIQKEYHGIIEKTQKNLNLIKGITDIYKKLDKDKAISHVNYIRFLQQLIEAEVKLTDNQTRLANLPYESFMVDYEKQYSKLTKELKIYNLVNRQNSLLQMHVESSIVYSPISGRVLSVEVRPGDNVRNGSPLMSIVETGREQNVEVLAYLSPDQGKKVKVMMEANVSPTIAKPQRYGSIRGVVTDISEYPVNSETMMSELDNAELVKELSKEGAPYRAVISLIPSITNKSGYEWTSSDGPSFLIGPGNLCHISVSVKELAPISYVFPFVKKYLLGD